MILFAGFHGTGYWDDTWSWNGTTWTQLSPATSPSGRDSGAFVYDPATSQIILFGGFRGTGFDSRRHLVLERHHVDPAQPGALAGHRRRCPAGRLRHGQQPVAAVRRRRGAQHVPEHDLDVDRHHDWTQLSPATSPPPRAYGAMTFDSATGQVVLFSGSENALKSFPTTTWAWNGSTWAQGT